MMQSLEDISATIIVIMSHENQLERFLNKDDTKMTLSFMNILRESFSKRDQSITDKPYGISVRNVKCQLGCVNTDKECPTTADKYNISQIERIVQNNVIKNGHISSI
uniref:Uncharacterized protein n=1 Tax=Tetranychus urticae TaxID=32264 RepID=T1JX64_TETUR